MERFQRTIEKVSMRIEKLFALMRGFAAEWRSLQCLLRNFDCNLPMQTRKPLILGLSMKRIERLPSPIERMSSESERPSVKNERPRG